ncbi:MAG: dihydrolipoyl dehydrogenase [Candidatus Sericytochromatia bacterium]
MDYDIAIIGAGPGGYVAALRAAQLGFRTVLIEKYPSLGGTCLNVGCIPSKALLDSSELYHQACHGFAAHGIGVGQPELDLGRMMQRKQDVVSQTTKGIDFLMKKNRVEVRHGAARFVDPHKLEIAGQRLSAAHMIIATGSKPTALPGVPLDGERIITSTEALSLPSLPAELLVIGGGIIGLELGSVYARLGSKVTVLEFLPALVAGMDESIGKELQKLLSRQLGMVFKLGHKVQSARNTGEGVLLEALDTQDAPVSFSGDICLVAVGRRAYTEGLGLEAIGLASDKAGRIPVNAQLQTAVPHIYAIGDVVAGPMLAHKAEEDGIFVVETLAGQKPHLDYRLVPAVIYTWPEGAGVGDTEQALRAAGRAYKMGSFPFRALGRARASGDLDGFVKILADAHSDEILGIHILGARAADLIAEAVVALEFRASAEDLARISHAHPSFAEAVREAALAATDNRALHI